MSRYEKIVTTLCVVIASSSAFASPYAFKITCKDPARMRPVGEETEFWIQCTDLRKAGVGGEVEVRLDNFGTKTIISRKVDPAKENPIILKGTLDEPGFLRAAAFNPGVAETPFGLGKGNECASVGYEPEKIRPGFPRPADFDTYWQGERERLRRDVPIDVRREPLSVKGRKGFKLWKVSFATFGGKRVWGLLSVPDNGSKGPWPLKVNVPGAGPACSEAQVVTEAGTVTLVMNVHPFEPARTPKEQDAKYKAQDKRLVEKYGVTYATAGIAVSREECFFHDAILGIDRAVDWAVALPEVDRSRVWYYGGSQGGGFGMYLMGLNKNFTKGYVWICALADHGGYRVGRTPGWPRLVARSGDEVAQKVAERHAPYFDACHFASLVKVPVRMTAGLSDVCCPPPSVWSAYNSLGSTDKKIVPCPGVGHRVPGGLHAQQQRWLAQ